VTTKIFGGKIIVVKCKKKNHVPIRSAAEIIYFGKVIKLLSAIISAVALIGQ